MAMHIIWIVYILWDLDNSIYNSFYVASPDDLITHSMIWHA